MKKTRILLLITLSLLGIQTKVAALEYISDKNYQCTETKEYKEWLKLSKKGKEKTLMPIKCEEIFDIKTKVNSAAGIGTIDHSGDSKFNLLNVEGKNYLTPVKDQGSSGLCWTYAANAAMESNYLVNGGTEIDLSEQHIAMTLSKNIVGYNYTDWFGNGGNELMILNYLMSNYGPVTSPTINIDTIKNNIPNAANTTDLSQEYEVENIQLLINNSCTPTAISSIKKLISTNGAVTTKVNGNLKYLSEDKLSFYGNIVISPDRYHAITIVGWDDNYSKENFKTTPSGDGAWIIKNSYTSIFSGGGADNLPNGYHYISYYDPLVCQTITSYDGIKPVTTQYNTYSHDFFGWTSDAINDKKQKVYYKEKFENKSGNTESLTKISLFGLEADDSYEVYYSPYDVTNIQQNATKIAAGKFNNGLEYNTINIDNPISISTDEFYIYYIYKANQLHCTESSFCNSNDDEAQYYFPAQLYDSDIESVFYTTQERYQAGKAMYSFDATTWIDTVSSDKKFYPNIKVSTKSFDYNIIIGNITKSKADLKNTDEGYINIPVTLSNISSINDITLKLYDSKNADVTGKFDIEKQENNFKINIKKGISPSGNITAKLTYQDITVSKSFTIGDINNILATSLTINKDNNEVSVNGTLILKTTIKPANVTNSKLTWKSSNENIAIVNEDGIVTGIKSGTATITAATTDGSKLSDSINVKVIDIGKEEGNGVTPSVYKNQKDITSGPQTGLTNNNIILISIAFISILLVFIVKKKNIFKRV